MSRAKGPKCSMCGGATHVNTLGSAPVRRITYCDGCNKSPGSCTCKPTSYVGRRRKS